MENSSVLCLEGAGLEGAGLELQFQLELVLLPPSARLAPGAVYCNIQWDGVSITDS